MPPQRTPQHALPSTPRKRRLFQCTGYGDCHMVFTRSEHLSRHSRKHTGEKPYKCAMPECKRIFSRFNNMMQHTQTHRAVVSASLSSRHRLGSPMGATTTRTNDRLRQDQQERQRRSNSNSNSSISSSSSSSSSSSTCYYSCDEQEEDTPYHHQQQHQHRLSVADLCSFPVVVGHEQEKVRLTVVEVETLQGFGFLQHTTSDFSDSLDDLITTVGAGNNNNSGSGSGGQGDVGAGDTLTTATGSTGNNTCNATDGYL